MRVWSGVDVGGQHHVQLVAHLKQAFAGADVVDTTTAAA